MAEIELKDLLMIYPYTKATGLFDKKRAKIARENEMKHPFTTNEGVIALQKFNLEIEQGEFVVLLGASGCGKSTLLRIIAGLETPTGGEVIVDGKCVNNIPPEQRDVAMVFQNYSLYPHLNVYDNIAFTLRNQKVPRFELDERVRDVAEVLQLSKLLDRRPKELSGGQQQRVAIGRAIIRQPKLFLMDEPFSNLDQALRVQLREVVRKLHQHLGTTFIYVTHDQKEALSLGSKIVVMRDGILQQVGTPREIFNHPVNRFVASFVGEPQMNFFENCPVSNGKVTIMGKEIEIGRELEKEFVTVGIRPVHLQISNEGIPGKVDSVMQLGTEVQLTLLVGDQKVTAMVPTDSIGTIMRGQDLNISFEPKRLLYFDPETNLTL